MNSNKYQNTRVECMFIEKYISKTIDNIEKHAKNTINLYGTIPQKITDYDLYDGIFDFTIQETIENNNFEGFKKLILNIMDHYEKYEDKSHVESCLVNLFILIIISLNKYQKKTGGDYFIWLIESEVLTFEIMTYFAQNTEIREFIRSKPMLEFKDQFISNINKLNSVDEEKFKIYKTLGLLKERSY